MSQPLMFKLHQHPASRGLRCDGGGLFLSGDALLDRDAEGNFIPRPAVDLRKLFSRIYGDEGDWESRIRSVALIANALNKKDLARATMTAVLMRLPDPDSPLRTTDIDGVLAKAGFNPDEPRDERGRWTSGGGATDTYLADSTASDASVAPERRSQQGTLDDGVYRPDSDPAELDPTASSPEQLKQNWQQHEDEVNRQVRWLESKGYGAIKVTKNVSFIGKNGVRVTVDYVVSRWLPDGMGGFWLTPDYGADVKTGGGGLRDSQRQVYPKIGSGTWVFPVGDNAISAGFEPDTWVYFPIVYGDALSTTEH